jgi:hypothetical protein
MKSTATPAIKYLAQGTYISSCSLFGLKDRILLILELGTQGKHNSSCFLFGLRDRILLILELGNACID